MIVFHMICLNKREINVKTNKNIDITNIKKLSENVAYVCEHLILLKIQDSFEVFLNWKVLVIILYVETFDEFSTYIECNKRLDNILRKMCAYSHARETIF